MCLFREGRVKGARSFFTSGSRVGRFIIQQNVRDAAWTVSIQTPLRMNGVAGWFTKHCSKKRKHLVFQTNFLHFTASIDVIT